MIPNIVSGMIAIAAGVLIAFINYTISKKVLIKCPDKYSFTVFAHQLLQVAYLAAVYLIASQLEAVNVVYPLVGSVLGMTVPMLFLTKKLLSINRANTVETQKEDDVNGREV